MVFVYFTTSVTLPPSNAKLNLKTFYADHHASSRRYAHDNLVLLRARTCR